MPELPFEVLPTDHRFDDGYMSGDEEYICSRCSKTIAEAILPILLFTTGDPCLLLRYHPRCVGFESLDEDDSLHEDEA